MSQASQGESGDDEQADGRDEITWVGAQHLMHGYCGRAVAAEESAAQGASGDGGVEETRPVAVVRTKPWQGRVVRIGPPKKLDGEASAAAA